MNDNELKRALRKRMRTDNAKPRLTAERKQELLERAAHGESTDHLALAFGISPSTVTYHIRRAAK